MEDIETRLNVTPALGLKHHFTCDCGVSGLVVLRIKCAKYGRETYWGLVAKEEMIALSVLDKQWAINYNVNCCVVQVMLTKQF